MSQRDKGKPMWAQQGTKNNFPIIILINLTIIIVLPQIQYPCPDLKNFPLTTLWSLGCSGICFPPIFYWLQKFLPKSSSKFLARKRRRHQDDKAKCNGVKEPETGRSRGQSCESSKTFCTLKAWELNKIIKQCQVSFFQCNLGSFYMGYHFSH